MNEHLQNARRQLSDLASLAAQTDRMERSILSSATERLAAVESEIKSIHATAISDRESSKRYLELIEERGILHQVIARANEELSENKGPASSP